MRFLVAHHPRDVHRVQRIARVWRRAILYPAGGVHGTRMFPELVYGTRRRVRHRMSLRPARRSGLAAGLKCTGRMLVDDGRVLGVRIALWTGRPASRWAVSGGAQQSPVGLIRIVAESLVFRRDSAAMTM